MLTMAGTVVSVLNEVIVPFFPVRTLSRVLMSNKFPILDTLFNNFHHQGHDEQIGYIGLVTQLVTVVSGLVLSRILDYTKAY